MGEDVSSNAIVCQMSQRFKPVAKLQLAALKAGLNPEHVNLSVNPRTLDAGQESNIIILFCLGVSTSFLLFAFMLVLDLLSG